MGVYDYDVPDFLNVDASDAVKSILNEPVAPYTPPPEPVAQEGEFVKGVKRGMEGLKSAGYGAAGLIGSGLGIDALRDWGYEGFQEHEAEAAKHAGRVQNIEDIKSIGDVGDWAAGTFGSLVPSIGEAAVTSAAGAIVGSAIGPEGTIGGAVAGLVGKQAAKSMMRKLAREYVKDGMERQVAKEAAKKAVESLPAKALMRNLGTKAGIVAGTAPIEAGGMWGEGMQQGKDNPYSAAVFGTLSGLSELLGGEAELIDVFTNPARQAVKGNILKRVGVELGKTIPQEAGQEATQEILAIINRKAVDPSYDMFGEDARSRVLNSAAAGALGGVAFGGVGGVMSGKSAERGTVAEEETPSPQSPVPEIDPWKEAEEPPHPVTAAEAEEQPVIPEASKGPLTKAAEAGAAAIPSIGDVTAAPVSPIGTVPNIGEVVPIIEPTRTTDELVLDDARDWAQQQIAAGKTQLMRQTQEAQNAYNQRLIDEYRKSTATPSMPDAGPKYANVQLVNPETGKAEVVKPEEVADRLSKGWREQGQEQAPNPQPPATESILSTVTAADRDALRMAQLRADYWERGSVDNGRSNKTQLFPWLNTWGKTTPAEVAKAIGNYLDGKKLGDVQQRLVEAALEFERENPVPFTDETKGAQSEKTQEEVRGQGEKRQVTLSEGERKKAEMYAEKAGIDIEGWPNEDISGFVKQYDAWRFAERQKEHITQKLRATKDPKARERLQKTLEQVRQRQEKLISKGAADVEETADIQGTSGETATGAETVPPVPELDGQPGAGMPMVQPADEIEAYSVPTPQPPAPNKGGVQSGLSEVQEEELGKEEEVSAVRGETVENQAEGGRLKAEENKAKFAEARRKHIREKLSEAKEPRERERLQRALARLEAERGTQQGKTEVEKPGKDIRKQRVEEFKKKYGYVQDEESPGPDPHPPTSERFKAAQLRHIRKKLSEAQTEKEKARYAKLLEKLQARKQEAPTQAASIDEEFQNISLEDFSNLVDEVAAEVRAEQSPPVDEKARRAAQFKKVRRDHITRKLAEAKEPRERERLRKALASLNAKKPAATEIVAGEKPEKDNGVESYFKKGQRVQLSDGTHGKVSEVTSYVMRSALLDITRHGGVGVTESKEEHNHMYSVRLDSGVETRAWYGNMFPETDPAPDVMPAPVYKGDAVDPGALLRSIQDDRNTARGKRAAASRAKKRENIDGHNRAADSYEKQATEKQAAFDAWADRYPEEAAKYRPKVEGKQEVVLSVSEANPRMSLKETVHSKKGHKLFVVVLNERVERDVYDRMNRDAKRTGNGYSSYRGHGAIPGFQFLDKGAAEEFMQRWGAASEGTTAETETPAAESKEQAQAESFNIGDEVYPVRDKDILKPGVVQHIQRDQYGKERIKVSNNGNAHWEVTDFAKQTQAIETPEQTRSAADILKDAALQGKEGMGEIVTGLYELFGGASLKSFPGAIDETTYAKAKPHFQAALEKFRASGEGIREFLRFLLEQFDPGIKPYLMRFVAELKGETFEEVKPGLTDGAQSDKLLNEEHQTKGKGDGNELSEDSSRPDGSEGSRGTEGERGTGSVSQRPGDERGDNGEGVRGRNSGENQEQERQGRNRPSRNGGDDSARTGRGRSLRHAEVTGHDYRITEEDRIGKGGAKEKARNNIAAIRLLKQIVAEGRPASAEEQAILTRYVGWGASELANGVFPERAWDSASRRSVERFKEDWESLGQELRDLLSDEEYRAAKASTLNAHYTSPGVIRGIWQAAQRLGFGKGRILEPGAGINLFLGLSPSELHASSRFTTVELDPISAGIAKLLYPTQDARHADFTKFSMPKGFYDLVIGNPPFADVKITSDPEYAKYKFSLHDYFFAKSMDLLRPGGIMALVTSRYTMDKANDAARAYLAKQADLVGAIRLPQTAFKENAGTEVVTDVLFLRKRLPGESPTGQTWSELKEIETRDGAAYVNEYFADHPEMVLGEHTLTSGMYGGNQYTVEAGKGNIEQAFADAVVKLPENVYTEPKIDSPAVQSNVVDEVAPSNIKEGAYYLDDKGNLLQKEKGVGLEVKGKTGADIIRSFVTLRDAARAVLHAQLADLSDAELLTAQRDLNRAYDSFTDKHGLLNKARPISRVDKKTGEEKTSYTYPNFNAFRDDPDASFVMALEDYDAEKQTAKKTDIFSKRVIRPEVEPKVESVADALHVVLHETGKVDMTRIAEMMGLTEEQAAEGLGDLVYLDPESRLWQTDDEYLSGYVKDKLAFAQAAAELDKKFERNVKALEAVQPADKEPSKIQISLGMPIIKPEWIQQFARDVIDMGVRVNHVVQTGQWGVEKVSGWQGAGATSDYGTARRNAADLLDAALNKSQVAVHDTVVENGKERRVLNEDETRAANEKLQRIKDRFASWIWTNPERSVELARRYNDEYNNFVKREYGGKHIEAMTFPGVSAVKTPFDHQRRVAWRIVQRGNTYMAHSVGAGKTIASVLAGMELKRLGIKKKPMWVVPNHMLQQFSREFLELYPAAKIIVADETNFQKENRERFLGRVASQNWDGVIITHSAFKMIPMSGRFQAEYIQDQIEEIQDIIDWSDKKEDRIKIKQLERQRMRLEERLAKAMNSVGQGKGVTFEETGIDQIFVDEAHEFRKLDFATNQGNIKGIDPNGSDKAFDLYMKANYLEKLYPGRSLVLMSGTPITNTIGEIYSIQRFLQGNLLKKHGLHNFDAWASTFGDIKTSLEKDPAGNYKPVTRFARFRNMTQLQQMVADVFDSVHAKDLHYLKRPSVRTGGRQFVLTKESPAQKSFKLRLEERIKAIRKRRGPPKKGDDILLSVITDGRHAALADEYAGGASGPESKLGKAVDNIHLIWDATRKDKKTQMVFMDLGIAGAEDTRGFSAYVWMRDELVKKGIPAKEIAFMQDYKKSSDKQKLFNAMNRGDVRVLIGSSASMGTGVNAQKLLAALHHMDPDTYLPSNIEQREGRIVRQGNSNDEVDLFVYATKGSFDETMWQFIESKQRFIDNFLNGNEIADEVTDVDGAADDYALAKAMSSDNPLVLEQAGVQAEVERLESLQRAHQDEQYRLARVVDNAKAKIEELEKTVRRIEESAGKRIDTSGKLFTIEVDGKTFEERKDAGAYLADKLRAGIERKEETEYEIIGKLAGYDLQMNTYFLSGTKGTVGRSAAFLRLSDGANATPRVAVMDDEAADIDPVGLVVQLENKAKQFESDLKQAREDILKHEKALKDAKERVGQSFEYAEQLEDRKARLRQIEQELQQSEQTEAEGTEEPVRFALRPDMTNKEALPGLVERGVREYTPGMKYPEFAKRMKAALGDMWERFKGLMLKVWGEVRSSVVEITVPENMADLPDQEFIEKSKIFAREKFAGSKVTNRNDGSEILIPWQGIKHTFSGRITRAEAAAALNLSAMIERARLVRTETDYHGRRNIHTVFKYNVVAVVEGKAVKINITVREHDDGKRYYDHYEIKKRSAGQSGELAEGQESHQPFTERSTDSTISPSGDDVKYALTATGYGLPVADIRSAFEPVYKNLPQAPPWRVVQTAAELPKRALDDAARRGIPQRLLQAVYLGNEVVYVADHFRSIEEAKQVILEEVVVHHGVRSILPNAVYEKHMLQASLWYANKRNEEWKAIGRRYGLDLKSRAGRIEAAEEMLGRDARTGKDSTMLSRIIAAVKDFLRSIGFDVGYGEAEIRELLGKARRFVEGKESPAPSPQPRPGVIDYGALVRKLREQGITEAQLQAFAAYEPGGARFAFSPSQYQAFDEDTVTGYENVPDNLMGFGKQPKGFTDTNYPFELDVYYSFDKGVTWHDDAIKGMNPLHALERARRNWPDAQIRTFPMDSKFALARLQDVKTQITDKGVSLNTTEREVLEADRAKAVEAIGETVKDYDEPGRFLFRAFYESDQDKAPGVVPYNPERGHYAAGENLKGSWWTTSLATAQEIAWSKAHDGRPVKIVALPLDRLPNGNVYIQNTNPPGFVYDLFIGLPVDVPISSVKEMPVDSCIRYALAEPFSAISEQFRSRNVLRTMAKLLNPLDWSRLKRWVEDVTPQTMRNGAATFLRNPVFEAEADPSKRPFVETGVKREETKLDYLLRFLGWDGPAAQAPNVMERLKKTYTQWESADRTTEWGRITDAFQKLTPADRKGVDLLLYRGDLIGKVFKNYEMVKGDPKTARVSEDSFQVYQRVRTHIDTVVADAIEQLSRQFMFDAGLPEDVIEKHLADYRNRREERPGWLPRNHGDGDYQVSVYHVITGLKWENRGDKDTMQALLPYFPSKEVADEIKKICDMFGLKYRQLRNGQQLISTDKNASRRFRKEIEKLKERIAVAKGEEKAKLETKLANVERTRIFAESMPAEQIQRFKEKTGEILPKLNTRNELAIRERKAALQQAIEDGESLTTINMLKDELKKYGDGRIKVKVYMRLQQTKTRAERHKTEVEKDLKKAMPYNYREGEQYETGYHFANTLSESMYGDMKNDFAVEQAQLEAINRAAARQEITKEEAGELRNKILQSTAEVLMARGAGRHQIRRAEYLIEGYDTEGTVDAYHEYMTGTAGMLSKARYAYDQFEHFRYAPAEVKRWAEKYIKDNLRNMGFADMVSGNLRALASFAYLGFKVSSMVINATQPWTLGIAELGRHTKRSAVWAIGKAQKDIVKGNLSESEKRLFATEIFRVQEQETAVHEMSGSREVRTGKVSRWMHTLTDKALAPFQEVELLNRKTVILAAYRTFRADGFGREEALSKALEVNRSVNFEMSRSNLPGFAQKPLGRTVYALQSFMWNNWNWVFNRLTGGTKEDMIALLRYSAAMAIIGGAAALPGGDELDKLYQMLFGESPKLAFQKWTRKHAREYGSLGEMVNGFAWHGLASATGVNISNAMRLQIPIVSPVLSGDSLPEAAGGVFTGLAQKGARAITAASRGDIYRMIENISPEALAGGMRAYRMATKGATTGTGKAIFDEQGRPMKYGTGEAIARGLGFQPSRVSERNDLTNVEKGLSAHWKEERGNLLAELRLAKSGERKEVMLKIMRFNRNLRDSQASGLVPVIKAETIRRTMTEKPNKRKAEWEQNQLTT